jgi:hypothetical protein
LNSFTSSIDTTIKNKLNTESVISSSIQVDIASATNYSTFSSSIAATDLAQSNKINVLELKTGSYATTGSNIFQGNQTITGSLYISQDLIVAGSSSIQHISSSVLNIADNIITVNAQNPSIRFGGLAVIDSGSAPQVSGSILFDSVENQWIFVHQNQLNVTSSMVIMGPETYNSLGNEIHLTNNRLVKSVNDEHIGDSNISDNGTNVSINSNTNITGSLLVTSTIVSQTTPLVSGSSQISYTGITNVPSGIVSGSGQVISLLPAGTVSGSSQITYGSVSGIPSGIVSGSSQISYTGITNIPSGLVSGSSQVLLSSGIWSGSAQLPSGVVSGSSQVLLSSGIWSGSAQLPSGIVSGAAQLPSGLISGSSQLPSGLVSGSSQVDLTATTNYSSGIKTRLNSEGVISGSSQVLSGTGIWSGSAQLPAGTVSGSSQIAFGSITGVPGGLVSGSAQTIANLPAGTVSGSSQVLAGTTIHSGSFFNGITVVSGSSQITFGGLTSIPSGLVSGSSQVLSGTGIWSGSAQLPSGVVSGSAQTIANLPSGTVSGSSQISLASTTGFGTYLNQGVLTTSSPTFAGLVSTGRMQVGGTDNRGVLTVQTGSTVTYTANTDMGDGGRFFVMENTDTSNTAGQFANISLQIAPTLGIGAGGRVLGDIRLIRTTTNSNAYYLFSAFRSDGTYKDYASIDYTGATFVGTIAASNFSGTHSGTSSGTNTGDQTNISGNAATSTAASALSGGGTVTTAPTTNQLFYTGQISSGASGLFTATDNSNSIITLNRHPGNYDSQLGFSSNGNIYYRSFSAAAINTSQAWQTIWTSNSLTNLNQLSNGPGYLTSITSGNVTTALGYTPYNSTNPNGYITSSGNAATATTLVSNATVSRDLYINGGTGGNFGNRLLIGTTTATYTLQDTNVRPTIYMNGAYPVLTMNHTATSNTNHGPTIQFTFDGLTTGGSTSRQILIGTPGNGNHLDFGFSGGGFGSNSDYNPHRGIAGYEGVTPMRLFSNGLMVGSNGSYPSIASSISYNFQVNGTGYVSSTFTVGGTFTENSSIRYKKDIETISYGLDKVLQMRGVTYLKKENDIKEVGVIAEEIAEIFPELVNYDTEGRPDSVSYGRITALLIEAIKDLKKEINDLKNNG